MVSLGPGRRRGRGRGRRRRHLAEENKSFVGFTQAQTVPRSQTLTYREQGISRRRLLHLLAGGHDGFVLGGIVGL